jgi:hypothetical protein
LLHQRRRCTLIDIFYAAVAPADEAHQVILQSRGYIRRRKVSAIKSAVKKDLPNHLMSEKRSYPRLQAYNPVDWCPWEDDTHSGQQKNIDVFLSIRYATCHGCSCHGE